MMCTECVNITKSCCTKCVNMTEIWSIDLYYTKRFGHIDAFSATQFGTIDSFSAHQFGLIDTFNTITSTRIWPLGLFLDHSEGELKHSKHILVIRGLKSITYQILCDHCWIPLKSFLNFQPNLFLISLYYFTS